MKDYKEFVPDVHYELIPINQLVSNQDYQRNLSMIHVRKTAEQFNLYQINPVKVSRRDGVNFVFNGQHTIETVALVSGSRETPVWCMIYDDMDYRVEADVFANQQKCVKPLSPYEIFMANIEADNELQTAIKALVESYGLTIGKAKAPGVICAVSSLELIYRNYGFHVLDRSLRLCAGTWEGDPNSLCSGMLKGIAKLIVAYGDEIRDDVFKEKVGAYTAREICRTARERKAGATGYAEAMLIAYNAKTRKGLDMVQLYAGRKRKKAVPEEADEKEDLAEDEDYQHST